jgi:uncharacterized membrane protein YccF (DUF307 family)
MSILGNIIWIVFGGLISAIFWSIAGLLLCITIIGIPFGFQCFKIASLALIPFGREIQYGNFGVLGLFGNIIWILICGIELCLLHLLIGLMFCITIIGIPFGLQHFKFAKLGLCPFGARTVYRGLYK